MAALGRARGDTMRDIVATIQREQDEAIRAPSAGVTEITGGPGTGKTAVALHRAAYLLYRHRRPMTGAGVLVIGPSPVFTNYISRVLPSMGEDSVELRALGEVLDGVPATRLDDGAPAAVKGSPRMLRVLRRAMRQTPPDVPDRAAHRVPRRGAQAGRRASWSASGGPCTGGAGCPTGRGWTRPRRCWKRCGARPSRTWPRTPTRTRAGSSRRRTTNWSPNWASGSSSTGSWSQWWPVLTPDGVLGLARRPGPAGAGGRSGAGAGRGRPAGGVVGGASR